MGLFREALILDKSQGFELGHPIAQPSRQGMYMAPRVSNNDTQQSASLRRQRSS